MLKSMTGYGQSQVTLFSKVYTLQVQAYNRRHLEMQVRLPQECLELEVEAREVIKQVCARGSITLTMTFVEGSKDSPSDTPDLVLIKKMHSAWVTIEQELHYSHHAAAFMQMIAQQPTLFQTSSVMKITSQEKELFKEAALRALQEVEVMRRAEGRALGKFLEEQLQVIEESIEVIRQQAVQQSALCRKRLEGKILPLLATPCSSDIEQRLLQEVVFYADRMDIEEEIGRLLSHTQQFQRYLQASAEASVGKTLEFLLQEMLRESNTLAAKAADSSIIHEALVIKSAIEKLKEQVQNIE